MKNLHSYTIHIWATSILLNFYLVAPAIGQTELIKISQEMLLELRKGESKLYAAHASEKLLKALPPEKVEGIWKQLESQLGKASHEVLESSENTISENFQYIQAIKFGSMTLGFISVFNPENQLAGISFQPYQPKKTQEQITKRAPYDLSETYSEKEITFQSGSYQIPGTLTIPKEGNPQALLIFVTGSGPNDRHSSIGPNRPHQDIAGGLAGHGIASLRFDKRTFSASKQIKEEGIKITIDNEVVDDAVSAISFAKTLEGINPDRIFLLGHSLGGMLAPRIASKTDLSGMIMMAANARPLEILILEQYDKLLDGNPAKDTTMLQLSTQIANLEKLDKGVDISDEELPLQQSASYWRSLRAYDQVVTAQKMTIPILIMQGESDYQVSMEDFNQWKTALPEASAISYPGLDHLMRLSNGKIGQEAYSNKVFVSDEVIKDIANWINKFNRAYEYLDY